MKNTSSNCELSIAMLDSRRVIYKHVGKIMQMLTCVLTRTLEKNQIYSDIDVSGAIHEINP